MPDVLQLLSMGKKTGCLSVGHRGSFGYIFFDKVPNLKFSFRKRVLHAGAAIGHHLQETDEVITCSAAPER